MSDDDAPPAAEQSIPSSVDASASPNQADLDRTDAAVLTCRFEDGRGKRLIFEPLDAGGFDVQERIATKRGWKPGGPWGIAETAVLENAHVLQRGAATGALRDRLELAYERARDRRAREELREALQLLDAVEAGL